MAKIPIGKDGIPVQKSIPASKRVCPYSKVEGKTGRLIGVCHEAKIVGILTKMEEDEDVISLMKRVSRITVELENVCPLFESCKLQAKCESNIRVVKDGDGTVIIKEPIPVKRIRTQDFMTMEESLKAVKKRRILKKKNEDFVGKAAKKRKLKGTKKQQFFRDADKKKVLI